MKLRMRLTDFIALLDGSTGDRGGRYVRPEVRRKRLLRRYGLDEAGFEKVKQAVKEGRFTLVGREEE